MGRVYRLLLVHQPKQKHCSQEMVRMAAVQERVPPGHSVVGIERSFLDLPPRKLTGDGLGLLRNRH